MSAPQRYPLIFNPTAKSQRGRRALAFIKRYGDVFDLNATTHAGHAREIAARYAAAGAPVVVAAGGDGTVNEVVSGIAGTGTTLGVLPTGTMNVFAREIGLPYGNLERCLGVILDGKTREVDLFAANGGPFVQMAGVGIDARVIEETSWESKKRFGPLAYVISLAKLLGERPPLLEVVCDDGRRETGVAALVGNGSRYGGPFRFFHRANNDDGKLDIIVFKESGYRMAFDFVHGLVRGGIERVSSAAYLQAPAFAVKSAESVPVEVDGELLGRFAETRFAAAPQRLRALASVVPGTPPVRSEATAGAMTP